LTGEDDILGRLLLTNGQEYMTEKTPLPQNVSGNPAEIAHFKIINNTVRAVGTGRHQPVAVQS